MKKKYVNTMKIFFAALVNSLSHYFWIIRYSS